MTENPMPNELDAVALERELNEIRDTMIEDRREFAGLVHFAARVEGVAKKLRAALASAKPAQAGEYDKALNCLVAVKQTAEGTLVIRPNATEAYRAEVASAIRTLAAERDGARRAAASYKAWQFPADIQALNVKLEAAEARVLSLETRLAAMGEALKILNTCDLSDLPGDVVQVIRRVISTEASHHG